MQVAGKRDVPCHLRITLPRGDLSLQAMLELDARALHLELDELLEVAGVTDSPEHRVESRSTFSTEDEHAEVVAGPAETKREIDVWSACRRGGTHGFALYDTHDPRSFHAVPQKHAQLAS